MRNLNARIGAAMVLSLTNHVTMEIPEAVMDAQRIA
jgi:hypothetical protein